MKRWIPLLLLFSCHAPVLRPQAVSADTAEERFFDWTELQFAREVHAERRVRMLGRLAAGGGGVLVLPSLAGRSGGGTFRQLSDFLYFTGLELPDSSLVLDADYGVSILFAPARDARFESASRPNDFPGRPLADDPELARRSGLDVRRIAELDAYLAERGVLELEDATEHVARLRMVKGPEEVAVIRQACAITAAGIRESARHIRAGIDERTLEAELEAEFKRRGAQRLSFDSIIKSGPNSLWPWRILAAHYDRRNRELEPGDLVIFDVGCELDHYASDVGRTFPASGRFTDLQREKLRVSTTVADAIIAAARPGTTLLELQAMAEAAIPADERPYMQTGVFFGHHIGLEVGDPSLPGAPLEPGMVFTVEPWYYNH